MGLIPAFAAMTHITAGMDVTDDPFVKEVKAAVQNTVDDGELLEQLQSVVQMHRFFVPGSLTCGKDVAAELSSEVCSQRTRLCYADGLCSPCI